MPLEDYLSLPYLKKNFEQGLSKKETQEALNAALYQYVSMGQSTSAAEIKELIDLGADVNYAEEGRSVLDAAIQGGYPAPQPQIVQMLLDSGATISKKQKSDGYTTIMSACRYAAQAEQMLMEPLALMENTGEQLMEKARIRREVARLVISKATKDDLIGISDEGKTVLGYAAPSVGITKMLQDAMQKYGMTAADLSAPKAKAAQPFAAKKPNKLKP